MKLEILPYLLPEVIDEDQTAQEVLATYSGIHPHWSIDTPRERNLMLDELGPEQDILVAYDEDKQVVGVASSYVPRNTDKVYLSGMAVGPEAQGTGVGVQLWSHLVSSARSKGARTIEGVSLDQSEDFYRKMGAEVTRSRILYELS